MPSLLPLLYPKKLCDEAHALREAIKITVGRSKETIARSKRLRAAMEEKKPKPSAKNT